MEIKGVAVRSIIGMVKEKYHDRYQEWFDSLPGQSKNIMNTTILTDEWYPMKYAATIPTQQIGRLFYEDIKTGAWESGRFSAQTALTGVYRLFMMAVRGSQILSRAGKTFQEYYKPSEIQVVKHQGKCAVLRIVKFPEPEEIIEYRIAGWIQRALELSNCNNVNIDISQSLSRKDPQTELVVCWE